MPASATQELAADALLGSAQVAITQKAWEEVEQHLSKVCCLTNFKAEWHLPWLEPGLHCAYQWWLLHFAAQHKWQSSAACGIDKVLCAFDCKATLVCFLCLCVK